ncbi:MAG: hypothetical protein KAU94_02320, partial [Verrucomicrobia bacterium]|nr:hypothetical protein [Verrucomicrobiota bacterium]
MGRGALLMVILVSCLSIGAETRTWTLADGQEFESEFVCVMGDKAVLKDSSGEKVKIKLARLSTGDRIFIELANPPRLEISFRRKSDQKHFSSRFST